MEWERGPGMRMMGRDLGMFYRWSCAGIGARTSTGCIFNLNTYSALD
jgi:hypothetical protein